MEVMSNASSQDRVRTEFHITSCIVYSYPSSGGIILKKVVGVELDYLGLPRTESPKCYEDPSMEDAFALRMLQLGAHWWPSLKFYGRHPTDLYPYGYHYPPDRHVGYPSSGGVVLLELFSEACSARLEYDPPRTPGTWMRVALCSSMDQRCDVLKAFGARYYEEGNPCDKLPLTLEEGVAEGKKYAELMRKLEDDDYLENWLNTY
jgi:hypothetical protein